MSYCKICGHEPNRSKPPLILRRYWEPDDGWVFGKLCHWCNENYGDRQPEPDDFAYESAGEYSLDNIHTDEDITDLL